MSDLSKNDLWYHVSEAKARRNVMSCGDSGLKHKKLTHCSSDGMRSTDREIGHGWPISRKRSESVINFKLVREEVANVPKRL